MTADHRAARPLDEAALAEIRERWEVLPAGPWEMGWDGQQFYLRDAEGIEIMELTFAIPTWEPKYESAKAACDLAVPEFLFHAREDIPSLLDALSAIREAVGAAPEVGTVEAVRALVDGARLTEKRLDMMHRGSDEMIAELQEALDLDEDEDRSLEDQVVEGARTRMADLAAARAEVARLRERERALVGAADSLLGWLQEYQGVIGVNQWRNGEPQAMTDRMVADMDAYRALMAGAPAPSGGGEGGASVCDRCTVNRDLRSDAQDQVRQQQARIRELEAALAAADAELADLRPKYAALLQEIDAYDQASYGGTVTIDARWDDAATAAPAAEGSES